MCISSLRNLNLMLLSLLQVQEHYAKKIFPKAKKKFSQLFFSPALTTSCGHAISVFLQKHSTDIVYRWHMYQDTMLFPSNGGQAICIHSHWGIWIHQCFAESENSTLKGFNVPLTLLPYKRYRLTPVYYK